MNPRRPTPEDLKAGWVIDYRGVREIFIAWLRNRVSWSHYGRQIVRYLDRYARPIMGPVDVVAMFEGLPSVSAKRHLANGLRVLFRFLEAQGWPEVYLNLLRKNLPRVRVGVDLWIPEPGDVVESLRRLKGCGRYYALYNLMVDSGLRLTEGVRLYNCIVEGEIQAEDHGDWVLVPLGYLRGTKLAYYGFITKFSLRLVEAQKPITYDGAEGVPKRYGIIPWKYLRKFQADKMTDEDLNIPESTVDFIQGRVPATIGARHYMRLRRKAIRYYPRWIHYLENLRCQAGLS